MAMIVLKLPGPHDLATGGQRGGPAEVNEHPFSVPSGAERRLGGDATMRSLRKYFHVPLQDLTALAIQAHRPTATPRPRRPW